MHFIWQAVCNTASDQERYKWWTEVEFFLLMPLFPFFYFYFLWMQGALLPWSRGQRFPFNYVSLWQSLCFWSVITVKSTPVVSHWKDFLSIIPRVDSGSLQAEFGVSHPLPLSWCLQTADTGFSILHAVGIFLAWNCSFPIKLISDDLRPLLCYERLEDGISSITANYKFFTKVLNVTSVS